MDESETTAINSSALNDEELADLALAADPNEPLDNDAVPWYGNSNFHGGLLPDWYMPRPVATTRGRATKIVIVESGQVVVNEGIGVQHFQSRAQPGNSGW